ncbi:MAG TPA: UbiD family decarboxylase [Casimicrobiaceae bacterium]|jgi:4-hydroxy-3-polyprenylbenzoate decarboxylase
MAAAIEVPPNRQQSLAEFVAGMEAAGLLVRIKDARRVDQLPMLMEQYPTKAIFVEKIVGSEFSFLANAYATHEQSAWALGCKRNEIGDRIVQLAKGRIKPEIVATAPCKQIILKEGDVDLTRLPLFLHHDRDGHAYTNDNLVVTKDPDTGVIDWGVYRSMFRTKNEKNFDMTCTSHRGRLNGLKYQARGQNMPVAIVLGGPTLDKLAAMAGVPSETNDFEVLGSFYGHAAQLVKCETNDLLVPANAEIVLEGEVITTEGWVHDEGPYGEFTGMYGGGLKHNPRVVIHCMTYRKGGIYQQATIGGAHPGYTDNMIQLPSIESDIFSALQFAGINVREVRCPAAGLSNIAYARIKPAGGGDAKQALAIMLTCSKQGLPKIAMVFDDDVDIWDDNRVAQCFAFRYMPDRDTIIIPQCNTMSTDPKIGDPNKPFYASKIGMDCTIPLVGNWNRNDFDWSSACDLGDPPANVAPMTEDAMVADMAAFIREAPRAWKEILQKYHGQHYATIYRAFGRLRHKLGRASDSPWFRYTFSDHDFASGPEPTTRLANFDPRHR